MLTKKKKHKTKQTPKPTTTHLHTSLAYLFILVVPNIKNIDSKTAKVKKLIDYRELYFRHFGELCFSLFFYTQAHNFSHRNQSHLSMFPLIKPTFLRKTSTFYLLTYAVYIFSIIKRLQECFLLITYCSSWLIAHSILIVLALKSY